MAWASKKQYAICMESEEGKDLIEKLPQMEQDEFNVEFGKLLGKSGASYDSKSDKEENGDTNTLFKETKRTIASSYNNEDIEIFENTKYFDEIANILKNKDGKILNGRYKLMKEDVDAFKKMATNSLKPDEILNTPLYKWALKQQEGKEPLDPNENEELVNQLSNEFYDAITKGKNNSKYKGKNLVLITGLPASGKSTGKIKEFLGNCIELDNDIAKTMPCLDKEDLFNGGLGANVVHQICKAAEANVKERLIKEGFNVAIPMIGDEEKSIGKRAKDFVDNGYTNMSILHSSVSNDESRKRVFKRLVTNDRFIPDIVIKAYGDGPTETFNRLKEKKGELEYNGTKFKFNIVE